MVVKFAPKPVLLIPLTKEDLGEINKYVYVSDVFKKYYFFYPGRKYLVKKLGGLVKCDTKEKNIHSFS